MFMLQQEPPPTRHRLCLVAPACQKVEMAREVVVDLQCSGFFVEPVGRAPGESVMLRGVPLVDLQCSGLVLSAERGSVGVDRQ
jgi:hypothetical protein